LICNCRANETPVTKKTREKYEIHRNNNTF
jgi:hypothetical protein